MVLLNMVASFDGLAEGAAANTDPAISATGGTVPTARAAQALRGSKGVLFSGAAASSFLAQNVAAGQATGIASHYFTITATPPAATADFVLIRNSTANMCNARLSTSNVFSVNDAGGTVRYTTTTALPPGNYRIALAVTKGTTTTNGRLGVWLRNADTGALVGSAVDVSGVNTGTADVFTIRHGKTSSTGTYSLAGDELGAGWGTFGEADFVPKPAPTTPGVTPTVNAGSDTTVDSWGSVSLTATSSKSAVAWSQKEGQLASLAVTGALTLAGEAPPALVEQNLIFRASTSDANGGNALSGFSISGGHLTGMNATDLARTMQMIADSGAKWIRWGFTAFEIELTNGVRTWTGHDRVVAAAKAAGLNIIGLLTSLPRWANTTNTGGSWGDGAITQAQRDAFTNFAVAAATRYISDITTWEIWNEANSNNYWAPEMTTAEPYTLLLKQVYPAIKTASPASKIIATGCARPRTMTSAAFYTSIYAFGGKDFFDYAGMHPYPNSGSNANTGEMSLLDNLIAVLDANGDATKPIWGTECGMATAGSGSVSYAVHGTLWKDLNDFWFANIGAHQGPLIMYSLRDKQPIGATTEREDYFGCVDINWNPKPSYFALQERNKAQGATIAYDDVVVKVLPADRGTISGIPIRRMTL